MDVDGRILVLCLCWSAELNFLLRSLAVSTRVLTLDEKMNAATHALGAFLSLVGLLVFFVYPHQTFDALTTFSCLIFSASLLSVYLSSTFYHLALDPRKKQNWKRWDHAAIFFLIAGTYTPFCLLIMPGPEATQLLIWVWILAGLGTLGEWFLAKRFRWMSTALYLALGWLVVWKWHLVKAVPDHILPLVIAGGLSYSLGTLFYLWRGIRFHHAIWHLFVIGGSAFHYMAVLLFFK